MIKKQKMLGIALALLVFSALFVSAQETAVRAYDGQSNTNLATAGLFFEDRDLFLSTVDIGSLDKNLFFLNFVAPGYFGGPLDVFDDNGGSNPYYNYYFDAGAGHFFGPWWVGTAFRFGSKTDKHKTDKKNETAVIDSNGIQYGVDSTTINGDANYSKIDNLLGISAIFGNKTWAISNNLDITNNRYEGYANALPGGAYSLDNLGGVTITPVTAGTTNITTTTTAAGKVTTESNTYSEGIIYQNNPANDVANAWFNTIEAGVVLGDLVPAIDKFEPWATFSIGFGLDQNGSVKGLSHDYSQYDSTNIGVWQRKSITYDEANAHFDIEPALSFGISLPLDEIFTFSPELSYSPRFYVYSNAYTDGDGKEAAAKGKAKYQSASSWEYGNISPGVGTEESTKYYSANVDEINQFGQSLSAGLKLAAKFDRFSLALKYVPTLETLSEKTTSTETNSTTERTVVDSNPYNNYTEVSKTTKDAGNSDKSTVTFTSDFKIGAQLWVKPDKFRINAGATVSAVTETITEKKTEKGTSTTTASKSYDDGHQDSSTVPSTTTTIAAATYTQTYDSETSYSGKYHMGCTYFFNDYLNLDFYLSNSATDGSAENNWAQLLMPSTWALQINIRY
jgi:hypothetical protein